jgi:anti-anti-sigma factor
MTVTTLRLEGRLDTAAVARLETGFAAKAGALKDRGDKAIIDLRDLTYISSMGIRLLVATLKQFAQRGVNFVTLAPSNAAVIELLTISNLKDHLNIAQNLDAAHAVLRE